MVDAIGLYSGMRPMRGARESTYFDLAPSAGPYPSKNAGGRDPAPGMYELLEKHPDQFTPVLSTKSMHGVLPCKGQPEAVRLGRFESSLTGGMYPQTGYARHQKPGLAIDHDKPMHGAVMPIAGFYNQDVPNVLGSVRG
jgi:hypothetical protein